LGISPEGIGFLGMIINFAVAIMVSSASSKPPIEVGQMVDKIRLP
jgi:cation/acetate symporter